MTRPEFQQIFKDIRDRITDKVAANVAATAKVIGRSVFDDNEQTWYGRLADENGNTHCWSIFYTGCAGLEDDNNPVATEIYVPTFRIVGYRAYSFGTDADNSSDNHMDEVNQLRFAFKDDPVLSMPDIVCSHTGFIDQTVLGKIDTHSIHITSVDMGVQLHPIPYEYPS